MLPVLFLLGWLFGSMSCRFLYTHPTTTDPKQKQKQKKKIYIYIYIFPSGQNQLWFSNKCENYWAVLHEKLRYTFKNIYIYSIISDWRRQVIQTVICKIWGGNINARLPFVYLEVEVTCILAVRPLDFEYCRKKETSCL